MPIENDAATVKRVQNTIDSEGHFDGTDCFGCNNFQPGPGGREHCSEGWCRLQLHSVAGPRGSVKVFYPITAAKGAGCGSFESKPQL